MGAECHSVSPVNHKIKTLISLDNLVMDWWLKGGLYGRQRGNLTDLLTYRTTITHFPMSPELKLENAYTIFRLEFPISTNVLVFF